MANEVIIGFLLDAVRALAAIVLSTTALYTGMNLLDRLTSGIDEWKEIKKGNIAVALVFVAVMLSMVLLMEARIYDVVSAIRSGLPLDFILKVFAITLVNYILGLIASIVAIFLTLHVIDRITPDVEEFAELKKGNVAVALIFAAALVLVGIAVRPTLESAFDSLIVLESALL